MGYRISLYCTPKEQVDAIRDITDKEVNETDYDILNQLKGELIRYDTLSNVLDTGREEELNLCTRIFNNKLDVECDESFYTISKDQLKNIIYYICQHNNYERMVERAVDFESKEVGNFWKRYGVPFESAVSDICTYYKNNANHWKVRTTEDGDAKCINVDLDGKWGITNGWTYEYYIFNLVYLYKIFDWEHNYLVAIGG